MPSRRPGNVRLAGRLERAKTSDLALYYLYVNGLRTGTLGPAMVDPAGETVTESFALSVPLLTGARIRAEVLVNGHLLRVCEGTIESGETDQRLDCFAPGA